MIWRIKWCSPAKERSAVRALRRKSSRQEVGRRVPQRVCGGARCICRAAEAAYPRTEEELIAVVAAATRENRKMKAATRSSHSIPKLACPGSGSGDGLLISTMHLNRTLKVDKQSMTMTVESGVSLRQLINDAAEAGLALPHTPYW
ncbi:unnamed protein product [Cuscuta campestris]|uniref:FAD-binding PCMH-type domain-containing protein n=1 Tax=Cuscuta campestris TaxID=132261 RepID=A0A484M934_9ASTE|nr:unnamed protein product [Cuscuta campestris]